MAILRIEHPVPDFEAWKRAFDSDPADRRGSGVRRYRIMRPVEDPNYVLVDLEFDTRNEAESLLAAMRAIWERVTGVVMSDPRVQIVDAVQAVEY
jgi:hypothetical protein